MNWPKQFIKAPKMWDCSFKIHSKPTAAGRTTGQNLEEPHSPTHPTLNNSNSFFGIMSFSDEKWHTDEGKRRSRGGWRVRCWRRWGAYLDGMAVDRISTAVHLHGSGDLQDVVWHIAGFSAAVPNLPPLLPVIQNLTDKTQGFRELRIRTEPGDFYHRRFILNY